MNIHSKNLYAKKKSLEHELLARIALTGGIFGVTQFVSSEDFDTYREEFNIFMSAQRESKNAINEFIAKGRDFKNIIEFANARSFADEIAKELKEVAITIKARNILADAAVNAPYDETIRQHASDTQIRLLEALRTRDSEKNDARHLIDNYKRQQAFYADKFKNGNGIIGLHTGYEKLDKMIDGLRPGHLWVIGGYTNTGKTQAAMNFVAEMVRQGKRVVIYSLEMSQDDILSRLQGIMTDQNGITIYKDFPHDRAKVTESQELILKSQLAIYTEKSDLSEIMFSMYEENLKKKVDLFVVDFIQLVGVKEAKSEYETITKSSLEMQQISKRLQVPVIILSQISNEGAKGLNDNVMTFKGSGAIAAAADLAIEIQGAEANATEMRRMMNDGQIVKMNWNIRKNRHGSVGTLQMMFKGSTGRFTNESHTTNGIPDD